MFLGGSQHDPWCSAEVGHLEPGQKHPDFRPKQSLRKSGPESPEGVGGYERRLAGVAGGGGTQGHETVVADDQP